MAEDIGARIADAAAKQATAVADLASVASQKRSAALGRHDNGDQAYAAKVAAFNTPRSVGTRRTGAARRAAR